MYVGIAVRGRCRGDRGRRGRDRGGAPADRGEARVVCRDRGARARRRPRLDGRGARAAARSRRANGCIRPTATCWRRSPNGSASRSTAGGPTGRRGCAAAARPRRPKPTGWPRARGVLLGDPSRRAGTGRPAGLSVLVPGGRWNALFDATSTWANAVELDCLSCQATTTATRIAASTGGFARAMEGCSRRSPRGCRSRTAPRRRASRMADGASGWRQPRHGRGGAGHRHRADRGDRRRASRLRPARAGQDRGGVRLPLGLADKLFLRFDGVLPGVGRRAVPGRLDAPARDDELPGAAVGPAADQLLFRRAVRGTARTRRHRGDGCLCRRRTGRRCSATDIRATADARWRPRPGAPIRSRAAPIPMRCPATPTTAPVSPRRSITGVLRRRGLLAEFFLHPHGAYETGLKPPTPRCEPEAMKPGFA